MPVNNATMITSDRITSIRRSNTRDQRLLLEDVGERWVFVGNERANGVQAGWESTRETKGTGQLSQDRPVSTRVRRRRRAASLVLDAALQIGDRRLPLVGMRHGEDHVDARVVGH